MYTLFALYTTIRSGSVCKTVFATNCRFFRSRAGRSLGAAEARSTRVPQASTRNIAILHLSQ